MYFHFLLQYANDRYHSVEYRRDVYGIFNDGAEEVTPIVCDYNALWRRRHPECHLNRTGTIISSQRPAYCLSNAATPDHRSRARLILLLRFVQFIIHISMFYVSV